MNLIYGTKPALWLIALIATAQAASTQPNLTPYAPVGWSNKIVVSKATGTTTDGSPLYTNDTLYVDWAVLNNGTLWTGAFYVSMYVDGSYLTSWHFSSLPPNFYVSAND